MGEIGELAVRLIVSLALVLGIVAAVYGIAKRRQRGTGSNAMFRRRQRAVGPATLEVEARAGLARGSAAIAVRFADRVVLVAVTDGAPATALAEIPAEQWDRGPEPVVSIESAPTAGEGASTSTSISTSTSESSLTGSAARTPLDPNGIIGERPSFIEALRDATSRRP